MYFQGKEHSDVYFNGFNHSKIYRGNQILWERLPPKFIFGGESMATSENLKTFSIFKTPLYNDKDADKETALRYIIGLEYAFGVYFALQRIIVYASDYSEYMETDWLLYSYNGYDWKKFISSEDYGMFYSIKKYSKSNEIEELALSTDSGLISINSELQIYTIADANNVPPSYKMISGNDSLIAVQGASLFQSDGTCSVINNGSYVGQWYYGNCISYNKKDGFFYNAYRMNGLNIRCSKDAVSWADFMRNVVDDDYSPKYDTMFFYDDFVYLLKFGYSVQDGKPIAASIFKTNGTSSHYQKIGARGDALISSACCIDGMLYYSLGNTAYRCPIDDAFSVVYSDSLLLKEKLRQSDYKEHVYFNSVVCTDEKMEAYY